MGVVLVGSDLKVRTPFVAVFFGVISSARNRML